MQLISKVYDTVRDLVTPGGSLDLDDAVAVVTGAGSGIGAALVCELDRAGARVAALDIDLESVERIAAMTSDRTIAIRADVTDRESMRSAYDLISEQLGPITVVVANAGVAPVPGTIRTMSDDDFDRVVSVNLTGVYNTIAPVVDDVIATGGHVVVIASVAAFMPGMGGSPYMASKAGAEQLGRALRIELAGRATAGVAYLGVIQTPMTESTIDRSPLVSRAAEQIPWPLNRRVEPRVVAEALRHAIERRSSRVIVPASWHGYALIRGVADVAVDSYLARSPLIRSLVREVESEGAGTALSDSARPGREVRPAG